VIDTANQVSEKSWISSATRIGWGVLILATLYVCYFSHLGAIGFVGPDEPRYAWIARDMMETGDWITPRLYGKPWFEKPVLYYWGAALCFKLFGVSEAAARLPSAVSALLATLALSWLALRLYGAETARWLLLLLPTTVGMIGFSHAAAPDMPFTGMLTIAMVAAAVVIGLVPQTTAPSSFVSLTSSTSSAAVLFGFSLGLAVLAKGPAAIILCGGTVFFWALFTKRWRDAFRLLHPTPLIAFCVTALPWYILCARRNPDFFHVFIIEHNFKRYLTPEFQHIQPFWFYIPILLIAFLPWTGAMIWTSVAGGTRVSQTKELSPLSFFLLSWSLFVMLFFTVSQSKLPGYILPAVPAFGLLLASASCSLAVKHRRSFGVAVAVFTLLCVGVSEFAARPNPHLNAASQSLQMAVSFLLIMIALANAFVAAGFLFATTGWVRSLMIALSVVPILFIFLTAEELVSGLVPLSSRDLARQLLAQHVPAEHTFIYHGISRGLRYGLNFYLGREVPDWDQNPDVDAYVVSGSLRCKQLQEQGVRCREVPLGSSASGWFVSHVTLNGSAAGPPDGGKPQ
jgi:4-amino-4-deoxy-L-arabinose transferase-like glycosyltransferase